MVGAGAGVVRCAGGDEGLRASVTVAPGLGAAATAALCERSLTANADPPAARSAIASKPKITVLARWPGGPGGSGCWRRYPLGGSLSSHMGGADSALRCGSSHVGAGDIAVS